MDGRMSRRGFLQQSVLTTASPTLGALPIIAAAQGAAGPPERPVEKTNHVTVVLTVNGTAHSLTVEPRVTLAEALRGMLGLRGTKIGCNRGTCSACTVWLDGAPVCSCMLFAVDVERRAVTTIEGLAAQDHLHPIQAAFIEHDAVQCGFCTPGMVMSCASLVRDKPNATAEDVRHAISGHLCRCGTYPHAVAATLAVLAGPKA
jgi:aerobic-type carbon monoxide dehydrogenase small subunit (CoxS/CutS family)